jgi:hypothetical protein
VIEQPPDKYEGATKMVNIEGIPIVAARLAKAAQDAKKTPRHKPVLHGASLLQQEYTRDHRPPAQRKPEAHIETMVKEVPCELL